MQSFFERCLNLGVGVQNVQNSLQYFCLAMLFDKKMSGCKNMEIWKYSVEIPRVGGQLFIKSKFLVPFEAEQIFFIVDTRSNEIEKEGVNEIYEFYDAFHCDKEARNASVYLIDRS